MKMRFITIKPVKKYLFIKMKTSLLLTLILISSTFSCLAQRYIEPVFNAGLIGSGMFYTNSIYKTPTLHFSAYNSANIGAYIAVERKNYRFDFAADVGFSRMNLRYTHPTFPNHAYVLQENDVFNNFHFTFSRKFHLPKMKKFMLGIGCFVTSINPIKESKFPTQTISFYDDQLGADNNRIVLFNNIKQVSSNDYLALFLQTSYHFNQYQFPFYIRVNYYAFIKGIASRSIEIFALDNAATQTKVDHITFGSLSYSFSLSLGVTLWQSKKFATKL